MPALAAAFPSFEAMREQVVVSALDRTCLAEPWPRDRAAFLARRDEARGKLSLIAQEIARLLTTIVAEGAGLPKKMNAVRGFPAAIADVEQQLARLFPRNVLVEEPADQLAHYPRYLKAIALRLEKIRSDPSRDTTALAGAQCPTGAVAARLAARKGVHDPRLEEFRWLLEELMMSLFAALLAAQSLQGRPKQKMQEQAPKVEVRPQVVEREPPCGSRRSGSSNGPCSISKANSRISCPSIYTLILCAPIGSPGA